MPTIHGRSRLRGADHRLLRGYGPLVGIVATLALVTFLVPSVQPEQNTNLVGGGVGSTVIGGTSATNQPGSAAVAGGSGGATRQDAAGHGPPPGATACPGAQVPGDSYSPACVEWGGGNNGGATSPGVDATTINVTLRETAISNVADLVKKLTGGKVQVNETLADVERTYRVLAQYFNTHFQFYGRKINIKFFKGQGDLAQEALGGGQATALSDAVNAAQQQHAFADIFALTQPYAEALVKNKVIALNELYMSKDWFQSMAPYAFSFVPDCTKVVQASADFIIKELKGQPAVWAGGDLKGKPRKIAIIAPDNPVYQSCANEAKAKLEAGGVPIADMRSYPLDINSLTNTTPQNLVSALSGEGITTVVLGTDPILPFFMTSKADLQHWTPEWVLTGVGLTDADYVGQLMNQDEWTHAFGVSYLAKQQPVRDSDAYNAYRITDPTTNIAELTGQLIYYSLEMLAIAIQGAGPDLTPQTFMQGLERYRGGTGQAGTWLFTPSNPYTPNVDGRIVWWDPKGTSSYNDAAGTYDDNGQRYPIGAFPSGPAPVYLSGGP
jgi:hypothetical protein